MRQHFFARLWLAVAALSIMLLSGCGGSSHEASPLSSSIPYQAILPDGSAMVLKLSLEDSGKFDGLYGVESNSAATADDGGEFEGTMDNGAIQANFVSQSGTISAATGQLSRKGFDLVWAGTTLHFLPIQPSTSRAPDYLLTYAVQSSEPQDRTMRIFSTPVETSRSKIWFGTWKGHEVEIMKSASVNFVLVHLQSHSAIFSYLPDPDPAKFLPYLTTKITSTKVMTIGGGPPTIISEIDPAIILKKK